MQLLEHRQRMLWPLARLACADGPVLGDHGVQEASELQLREQMAASHSLMAAL